MRYDVSGLGLPSNPMPYERHQSLHAQLFELTAQAAHEGGKVVALIELLDERRKLRHHRITLFD